MEEHDLEGLARAYLDAFDRRDLAACMDFFTEEAVIDFAMGVYRGRDQIEEWHNDRFTRDLRIVSVQRIDRKDDAVTVYAKATSKVVRSWRFGNVKGSATFRFEEDKIAELRFRMLSKMPLENW